MITVTGALLLFQVRFMIPEPDEGGRTEVKQMAHGKIIRIKRRYLI